MSSSSSSGVSASASAPTVLGWTAREFGLDSRFVKAISKLGYRTPTSVQAQCIPVAMQGKDILVKARTGSGKTLAFALPLLSKLLLEKESSQTTKQSPSPRAVVLAPTNELCNQIEKQFVDLTYFCRDLISLCSLCEDNKSVLQFRLQRKPDIVIATPAKLIQQCKAGAIDLSQIKMLVIDEADLVLSFGYNDELNFITSHLPKIFQGLLVSATLSPQLEKFKKVVLHNPLVIKVEEEVRNDQLLQFYLPSTERDKFLILYVFLKLGLLQGKGLIFVNEISKGYKVKLFLQQFFISAAVLNSELPLNSRLHIMEEFNRGVFDLLIATDACFDGGEEDDKHDLDYAENSDEEGEQNDEGEQGDNDSENEKEDEDLEGVEWMSSDEEDEKDDQDDADVESGDNSEDEDEDKDSDADGSQDHASHDGVISEKEHGGKLKGASGKTKQNLKNSQDYGVSRGIDFQDVGFVLNFDFPKSSSSYTHRIGRTARGSNVGTSLSFVLQPPNNQSHKLLTKSELNEVKTSERDTEVLKEVRLSQPRLNFVDNSSALSTIQSVASGDTDDDRHLQPVPLSFNMKELDSFRYRVEDVLRSVSRLAIKELRLSEIRREIMNSKKLKNYFAENPNDLAVLRHDKAILHPIKQKPHLKSVPTYLIPSSMKSVVDMDPKKSKKRKNSAHGQSQDKRIMKSKMNDPLNRAMNSIEEVNTSTADTVSGNEGESEGRKVYTAKEVSNLGQSIAGRREWQKRHGKGKFNEKEKRKNAHLTPGTFRKAKRYS